MPTKAKLAAEVATALLGAYLDHRAAKAAAEDRARHREAIIAEINRVADLLISDRIEARLREIKGELSGLQQTYRTYEPRPGNEPEENRLVAVIDGCAGLIGAIQEELLNDIEADTALAVDAVTPYLGVLLLRGQAQTERDVTYGSSEAENTALTFEEAVPFFKATEVALERDTQRRFGDISCGRHPDFPPGVEICSYGFDGRAIICGTLSNPTAVASCSEARATHQQGVYASSGGAVLATTVQGVLDAAHGIRQELLLEMINSTLVEPPSGLRLVEGRIHASAEEASAIEAALRSGG